MNESDLEIQFLLLYGFLFGHFEMKEWEPGLYASCCFSYLLHYLVALAISNWLNILWILITYENAMP